MRLLSQALNPCLKTSVEDAKKVIQHGYYEFHAVRRNKFHQQSEDVLKEFKEISNAALDFEDGQLTHELDEMSKIKKEASGVQEKEKLVLEKAQIMIKELREFVKDGFVGVDSQSSST